MRMLDSSSEPHAASCIKILVLCTPNALKKMRNTSCIWTSKLHSSRKWCSLKYLKHFKCFKYFREHHFSISFRLNKVVLIPIKPFANNIKPSQCLRKRVRIIKAVHLIKKLHICCRNTHFVRQVVSVFVWSYKKTSDCLIGLNTSQNLLLNVEIESGGRGHLWLPLWQGSVSSTVLSHSWLKILPVNYELDLCFD